MVPILALFLAGTAVTSTSAFAPRSAGASAMVRPAHPSSHVGPLSMAAEGDKVDAQVTVSGRKEIGYDEKTGRFFETDFDPVDCIPDEEYCIVDKASGELVRLTLEEKERIFLDALQSYYVSGRQLLGDSDFDRLKEDLSWNGSSLASLNRKEAQYLAATEGYLKGKPILTDEEFDVLKQELKEDKSKFAIDFEPKCYIDTGICKVTFQVDKFRNNLLYLPVGAVFSILWLGLGFEVIEPLIRLNPLILAALGGYPVYKGALAITDEFIFQDTTIIYGPCPSCEAENRVYFGNILGVEGFGDVAGIKCTKCKAAIQVQRNTFRASTLPKSN